MVPIIGFRAWVIELEKPILRSVAMRYEWPNDGEAVAKCMMSNVDPSKHAAPFDTCRCGLHARTTQAGVTEEYPYYPVHGYWAYRAAPTAGLMCMGVVLMYGEICRGAKVIRSERAKVLCMTDKPDNDLWKARMGSNDPAKVESESIELRAQTLDAICRTYQVPLIPWAGATSYAAEFGELASEDI